MTASPTVAPPATGIAPDPDAPVEAEDPRRRRKAILLLFLLGALILLIGLAIWYLLFRQPIQNVIPVVPASTLPGYATSVYGADRPFGVAVSSSGDRIYVAETNSPYRVLMYDGSGTQIGTFEAPPGASHVPVYLALNPVSQEVYVSDRPSGTIWIYDANGH